MKTRVLLALSVLFLSASASAQQYRTSHFKFWSTLTDDKFETRVTLKGQFDKERWRASVSSWVLIGNPVIKNEEPVPDRVTHLVAYRIKAETQPRRTVVISNQVQREGRFLIGQPVLLLLPAAKSFAPAKPERVQSPLDHFVCYQILEPPVIRRPYRLEDQFDVRLKKPERIDELKPELFCVPVSKNGEEIHDPRTHLTLYAIAPPTKLERPFVVNVRDQFGLHELRAVASRFLGVPTLKKGWEAK